MPKSTSNADAGYVDDYRGWYDVQGCGRCLDYCRWVGNSGTCGDPSVKLACGSSFWSCRLAGSDQTHNKMTETWSFGKCDGEDAQAPTPAPPTPPPPPEPEWVLLFRQTAPAVYQADQWSRNPYAPSNDNYAILDQLEGFRQDGEFEFKMTWPGSGLTYQRWKQTSNPVTRNSQGVDGYEAIVIPYTERHWGGLENSQHPDSLLDGSVSEDDSWYYPVGARRLLSGGYPLPSRSVPVVELYVGQWPDPNCKDGEMHDEPVINYAHGEGATCRSLRWACVDYAFVSNKCKKTCQQC